MRIDFKVLFSWWQEVKQDLIIDLVGKCRAYKLRVVHLINSTT